MRSVTTSFWLQINAEAAAGEMQDGRSNRVTCYTFAVSTPDCASQSEHFETNNATQFVVSTDMDGQAKDQGVSRNVNSRSAISLISPACDSLGIHFLPLQDVTVLLCASG
jgi:hypothetical protein